MSSSPEQKTAAVASEGTEATALSKSRAFAEMLSGSSEAGDAASAQKAADALAPVAKRQCVSSSAEGSNGGRCSGTACRWNDRGFGFIKPSDGSEDVFCHFTCITDGSVLAEGATVEFDKVFDEQKNKWRADKVTGGSSPAGVGGGAQTSAEGVRACPERSMLSRMVNPSRKSFFICKLITAGTHCAHGDRCMFAHSEAERVAWTAERDRRVQAQQGMQQQPQQGYGFQAQAGYQLAAAMPQYAAMVQPQYFVAAPQYAAPVQAAPAASSGPVAALEAQLKNAIAATDFILCAQLQSQIKQLKAQQTGPSPAVQAIEAKLKAALAAQDFVLCAQYKAELDAAKGSAGASAAAPQMMVPRQQTEGLYAQQQDPYQQAQVAYQQQAVYQQQAFQPQAPAFQSQAQAYQQAQASGRR